MEDKNLGTVVMLAWFCGAMGAYIWRPSLPTLVSMFTVTVVATLAVTIIVPDDTEPTHVIPVLLFFGAVPFVTTLSLVRLALGFGGLAIFVTVVASFFVGLLVSLAIILVPMEADRLRIR